MAKAPAISFAIYGRTDVGLIREHNEDNFLIADFEKNVRTNEITLPLQVELTSKGALMIVADGMGGAAAGEVASQMAVESISSTMDMGPVTERDAWGQQMRTAIENANDKIYAQSRDNQSERGMGTTCTVAGLVDDTLVLGQIGDSRGYILRRGRLAQVTKDQSLAWQLIEAGAMTLEESKAFEHANIILQALGVQERVDVVLSTVKLKRDDVLLLSSDGLHGPVSDDEIAQILNSESDLKKAGDMLIARALEREGPDNVTVVVARATGEGLPAPTETDLVAFVGYDPGGESKNARASTERPTQEVNLPRTSDSTTENELDTLSSELPTPGPQALYADPEPAKSESKSVVLFAVITLVAALALGLWLRFDRQQAAGKAEEGGAAISDDHPVAATPPPLPAAGAQATDAGPGQSDARPADGEELGASAQKGKSATKAAGKAAATTVNPRAKEPAAR